MVELISFFDKMKTHGAGQFAYVFRVARKKMPPVLRVAALHGFERDVFFLHGVCGRFVVVN